MSSDDSASGVSALPPGELVPVAEAEAAAADETREPPGPQADPLPPEGRRRRAARGAVINSVFVVGLGGLNLVKSLIVVGFISASEFGVWSIVVLALYLVIAVKAVAVADKYIQQDEADQELAFRKAITLELSSAGSAGRWLALAGAAAVAGLRRDELIGAGARAALVLPGLALQAPIWIFYRRMDFLRQRLLIAVDPIGRLRGDDRARGRRARLLGLVLGVVAGAWAARCARARASPVSLPLRFDRAALREYLALLAGRCCSRRARVVVAQLC